MNHNSSYAHPPLLVLSRTCSHQNYLWKEFTGELLKLGLLEEVANQTAW